jgi:Large polyvalent protein-associated domain 7
MFENSITPEEPRRRPVAKDAHTDAVAQQYNLYTADNASLWGKTRVYYADYQQKSEVMRAQADRITTKLDDRHTVSTMLDLAQSRGWDRIKLRGSKSFRREAWVQAQVRGIEASGYRPLQTDMQEAARRQAAAQPVSPPAEKAKASAPAPAARQVKKTAAKATAGAPQQSPPRRAQEKSVWNAVETAGLAARGQATVKPAENPAEKPPAAVAA